MALEHLWYCAYGNHVATAALESLTIRIARFWLTHHRHQGNRWLLITRKKETERRQGSWSLQPTAIACAIPMERLYPSLFRVGSNPFFFPLYNCCLDPTIPSFVENGRVVASFLFWSVHHAVPGCAHAKTCASMWNDMRNLSLVFLSFIKTKLLLYLFQTALSVGNHCSRHVHLSF